MNKEWWKNNWKFVASVGAVIAVVGLSVVGYFLHQRPVVADLDEKGPQRGATITVSDPQLYARETLINDRREEYEYLSKLLEDSGKPDKVQFSPQIIRDLNILAALKAHGSLQLPGGAEPPKPAAQNGQDAEGAQNAQNTQNTQNTQGATVPAKDTKGTTTTAQANPPKGSPSAAPQEEFRDRQAYRGDLRAALASINLDDLHDLAGNALFRLQFKVTTFPGEVKNKFGVARVTVVPPVLKSSEVGAIYRMWLGHTSSRLNYFNADGNLVGDSQYGNSGMARFTSLVKIGVPKTSRQAGEKHRCLSQTPAELRAIAVVQKASPENVQMAKAVEDLDCYTLSLAVLPNASPPEWLYSSRDTKLLTGAENMLRTLGGTDPASICRDDIPWKEAVDTAVEVLEIEPALEAALDGIVAGSESIDRQRVSVGGGMAEETTDLSPEYQRLGTAAAEARAYLGRVAAAAQTVLKVREQLAANDRVKCAGPAPKNPKLGKFVAPDAFFEVLTKPAEATIPPTADTKQALGHAYAYGTTPVELAQRLSTTASTAASMELALAMSGKLQEGALSAGSGYTRSMAQTAAFLERLPVVVGFSDRRDPEKDQAKPSSSKPAAVAAVSPVPGSPAAQATTPSSDNAPQFGWVFGPRARFDQKQQRFVFEQSIASHDVAADISVPSWWPRVELQVETAWVANWNEANEVLKKDKPPRSISVPLPMNRADLDSLTKFLMRDSVRRPAEFTAIELVEPNVISACANEVTILIYGANIWRSAEVYLGGLRSKEIKVLPDMAGISAKFELKEFYKNRNSAFNPLGYEEVTLRINTRNGKDSRPIRIAGSRQPNEKGEELANCTSAFTVSSPALRHHQKSSPAVLAMAPSSLERCEGPTRVMITGRNLLARDADGTTLVPPQVLLNGSDGQVTSIGTVQDPRTLHVISLTFPKGAADIKRDYHDLIIANQGGFAVARLAAPACRDAKNEAAAPPPANSQAGGQK